MRNTIFILLMIAGTFTFNSSFAQTKIKLKPSRTLPVFENYRSSLKPYYAFSYKDKKYMLFNEVNGVYNYWVINLTFRPISCGFHFVQYDAASNKIGKQETIHTDLDVSGHSIDGAFCSNDSLIIISHLNNVNKGQVYFFATIYNLEAKKSKSFKVYDCSSSDSYSLKIYDNEQPYRFSVVSQSYKSKTVELSYLISGTNLQPVSYAEKVTLKEIKRDELMDFEVTKNGNLILETAIREKKTSKGLRKIFETAPTSNELFLVRGSKLSKFETNSGSSHTFKRVFYDKNDKLKVANLYFEKNYASGGIYLADLNEENGMVENINKFDFTDMEFENAKSAKSQSRENQRTLRDINRITSIQISPEGNVYILAEHFQITKVTTTSRNANGFTTQICKITLCVKCNVTIF